MTDRSLVHEKILPGQLLLQTEGVCNFDAEHLLEVWGAQRLSASRTLTGLQQQSDDVSRPGALKPACPAASHAVSVGTRTGLRRAATTVATFTCSSQSGHVT